MLVHQRVIIYKIDAADCKHDLLTSRKPRLLPWTVLGCRVYKFQSKLTGNGPTGAGIGPNLPDGTYMRNCVTCVRKPLLWTTRT